MSNMSKSQKFAWFAWAIASVFYAYQYILRVMPSIMLEDITHQFHIDATVFGQVSGVYYIAYSLVHLPIGILLDRFGPRKIMTGCILLTVIGLLPIVYAEQWIYPILGRALIGIGSSAAILGTFKIIRMSFRESLFPRMLSLSVTIGLIGAIYGGEPVSYLCHVWGYKAIVEMFIVIGLILAGVTYVIAPEVHSAPNTSIMHNVKTVITNGRVIGLCCFSGLMLGPLEGFSDVWGPAFLKQVYGLDDTIAHSLPSMIFVGMCFGAPILSLIAEKTKGYLAVIITSGLIMLLTFTALVLQILSISSITLSFLIVGVCCAYQILAIYKASTYVPEQLAGLTTAIANMIIMSFGYGFHASIGFVIHYFGGTKVNQAFIYGISVIPVTLALGVLGFLLIACQERFFMSKK